MMKRSTKRVQGSGAIDLIEEAIHLLRTSSVTGLFYYYLGSVPFMLALLFFWTDMSRGAMAEQRLAGGALGLSLFFIWMKFWQHQFAQELLTHLNHSTQPRQHFSCWLREGLLQGIIQPTGLFLIPLSQVISVPFGWVYAFYQNVTALNVQEGEGVLDLVRRASKQALLWPMQNHLLIWLLCPWLLMAAATTWAVVLPLLTHLESDLSSAVGYLLVGILGLLVLILNPLGVVLAANLGFAIFTIPELVRMFFGIETAFTRTGTHMLNSSLVAVTCGLAYLGLDPIIKAAYTLRCFYGEALQNGSDLRAELKGLQRDAAANTASKAILAGMLLLAMLPSSVNAAADRQDQPAAKGPAVSVQELDEAISETLDKAEYRWRMPRKMEGTEDEAQGMFASLIYNIRQTLEGWAKSIGRSVEKVINWIIDFFRGKDARSTSGSGAAWAQSLQWLLFLLIVAAAAVLVILVFRMWRSRPPMEVTSETIPAVPDLAREDVSANELPEDGWLNLARDLMTKGEWRLALRALYLASLAHLAQRGIVTIAIFKSNRDYERELSRRAHALPQLGELFAENVLIFERVWYGRSEADEELLRQFTDNMERIKSC